MKQNNSVVCSKCILPNEKNLNDLIWWFHMNFHIGQHQVDVCNPLGIQTVLNQMPSFRPDFIKIRSLSCFPNLKSQENVDKPVFSSYDEYISANGRNKTSPDIQLLQRMDILNEVIINECYFDYIDKYK